MALGIFLIMAIKAILLLTFLLVVYGREIKLINYCPYEIWPGWWGRNGIPDGGGTTLRPGLSRSIHVPDDWIAGRIWARTGCDGNFNCDTGGCGNSEHCNGRTGEGGVTLAEFTFKQNGPRDHYDISLVDGYNVQMKIKPMGGNCREVGHCTENLLHSCPNELKVHRNGRTVKCESACTKFHNPEYCCTGNHNKPQTCGPSHFSRFFKERCHDSYSYAYDDGSSLFTCENVNYEVHFC